MRVCAAAIVLCVIASCGDDGAHHGAGSDAAVATDGAPDGSGPDAAFCSTVQCCSASDCVANPDFGPGSLCTPANTCETVAGTLSGLLWQLPCNSTGGTSCTTLANATVTATLAGTANVTYDVALHFRGVVEEKAYTNGCTGADAWVAGGVVNGDTYNVYRLKISSPPQVYYLNFGTSGQTFVPAIDLMKTVRIDAGATVTLYADAIDGSEIRNLDTDEATPISISGTSVTQPYDGQFIEMDVETVTADPIATGATVGGGSAGSALSFAGSNLATVQPTTSLTSADVTTEMWFAFGSAAPGGSYNTILGRAVNAGLTSDTYTTWWAGNQLRSMITAGSGAGDTEQVATPWVPVAGEWHHATTTYDSVAGRATFYLDGGAVLCYSAAGGADDQALPILIGGDLEDGANNGFWVGTIDEVRMFSTARSPDQIWADLHTHQLGATTGLVGEWTFDEGTGQTSTDRSGAGNDAVLGDTSAVEADDPTWTVSTVPH